MGLLDVLLGRGGGLRCPICKADIPEGVERCPKCRRKVSDLFELVCTECKKRIPWGSRICPNCGAKFGEGEVEYTCPNCGYKTKHRIEECPSCGTRFV